MSTTADDTGADDTGADDTGADDTGADDAGADDAGGAPAARSAARSSAIRPDGPLRVVVVYPDLLGTYGDGGNAVVIARRAAWRGLDVELMEASSDRPLPMADVYCLGGGEDGPQARAVAALQADGTLRRAVDAGAVVLAVCAGFQIVGRTFAGADGQPLPGLGLLDVESHKGAIRAVGEVVAEAGPIDDPTAVDPDGGHPHGGELGARLPLLTGFENHAGVTRLGPSVRPLGRVRSGVGNGDGTEGAVRGRLVGTYLHGPVLARNPALADLLIGWATGNAALAPLDDHRENALRVERLNAVRGTRFRNARARWPRSWVPGTADHRRRTTGSAPPAPPAPSR
jgi:CobQ-like glutamine amidotransferase family enzyme